MDYHQKDSNLNNMSHLQSVFIPFIIFPIFTIDYVGFIDRIGCFMHRCFLLYHILQYKPKYFDILLCHDLIVMKKKRDEQTIQGIVDIIQITTTLVGTILIYILSITMWSNCTINYNIRQLYVYKSETKRNFLLFMTKFSIAKKQNTERSTNVIVEKSKISSKLLFQMVLLTFRVFVMAILLGQFKTMETTTICKNG